LPFGIPGIADEIDGAVQQAPQSERQLRSDMGAFDHHCSLVILPAIRSTNQRTLARFATCISHTSMKGAILQGIAPHSA
jgi:hypothetical protein